MSPRDSGYGASPAEGLSMEDQDAEVEELDRAVTRFYQRMSNWEESVAERVGLTPTQCHVLSELGEAGPIRMKPLSERIGITSGTLTVMADRLEKAKLLRRAEDPQDKRASIVELAPKGREKFLIHIGHHRELAGQFFSALGPEGAKELVRLLDSLSESV
jgi:DNA-binding MarR family transcriptional regulator